MVVVDDHFLCLMGQTNLHTTLTARGEGATVGHIQQVNGGAADGLQSAAVVRNGGDGTHQTFGIFVFGIVEDLVGSAALADLAGLNFAIRNMILKEEVQFNIIAPTSVKKFAVGNGGAEKDVMIASWKKLDNNIANISEVKVDDLADSYFIAHFAE